MRNTYLLLLAFLLPITSVLSNEKNHSVVDDYFTFLQLDGDAVKSSLVYNSYSLNSWEADNSLTAWSNYLANDRTFWTNNSISLLLLDPEILISGNTTYSRPELNDGSFWQGKGLNTFVSMGMEFQSKYVNAVFYPEFWVAQNLFYSVVTPYPTQPNQDVGYFFNGIDYPQRMAGDVLWNYNWGQTGLHFNVWQLTLGFSHENIKIGPSRINPLLLSNNASGFWHMNFGLKKTETKIGDFEWQFFWGQLKESDSFDNDESNDKTFSSGMVFGYEPSFIPGLVLGINRTLAANWTDLNSEIFFQILNPIFFLYSYGHDLADQRASLTLDWHFPTVGFQLYGELFYEDYTPDIATFILDPGHAAAYTLGIAKSFPIKSGKLMTLFEFSQLIQSRDYEVSLGTGGTYYSHHIVIHGHTNEGQLLGAGIGPGSDSQTFQTVWYLNWGRICFQLQRIGWHKDYIYQDPKDINDPEGSDQRRLQAEMNYGIDSTWLINSWELSMELMYSTFYNRNFERNTFTHNLYGNIGAKYRF